MNLAEIMMEKISVPAVFLALCLASPAWAFQARTKTVHDGDSLKVQRADKQLVTIRLYGIDAPEFKQAFGQDAKKRLMALVARKNVDIEPVDTDHYGRTVALVRLKDGTLVNEVMVADGLAWVYTQSAPRTCASTWPSLSGRRGRSGAAFGPTAPRCALRTGARSTRPRNGTQRRCAP